MYIEQFLKGKRIQLRSVVEDDAAFILDLRLNPELNKFLNPTSPILEDQIQWIKKQRIKPNDYYFIIQNTEGSPLGTVGLYDIDETIKTFDWGRWIISKEAPFYTLIESMMLIYNFAFDTLLLNESISGVKSENTRVIEFHQSYGCEICKVDEEYNYLRFIAKDFPALTQKFAKFIL